MDLEYIYDKPSLLNIKGSLILSGKGVCQFAPGLILFIGENAYMKIGDNFTVSHDTKIYIKDKLIVGDDNMWSYYNVIMDNDGHTIYDNDGILVNSNKPVVFGNHVWMGCGCKILKGTCIADNNVIASGSIINTQYSANNCIITSKNKIIRRNIIWDRTLI